MKNYLITHEYNGQTHTVFVANTAEVIEELQRYPPEATLVEVRKLPPISPTSRAKAN